jgi:hypothetical protein
VFRGAVFKHRTKLLLGYDDTNHEPEREEKRLVCVIKRRAKAKPGSNIGVLFLTVKRRSMAWRREGSDSLFDGPHRIPTFLWAMGGPFTSFLMCHRWFSRLAYPIFFHFIS